MNIASIIAHLEMMAPPSLQEGYDNAGLLTGSPGWTCTGVLLSLDVTEAVVAEAVQKKCNLVIAHHPIIFGGLKRINGNNYVERTVIAAIKNDIALYAIHTNLDNVLDGVSGRMADVLGLVNRTVLAPKAGTLLKLYTFVPMDQAEEVRSALFGAGAGKIGRYGECSFNGEGQGTFKGDDGTMPFVGQPGERHTEPEVKIEVVLPAHRRGAVVKALQTAHPYEEVAYDLVALENTHPGVGSGLIGELPQPMEAPAFLELVKTSFKVPVVRHTRPAGQPIRRVALCGGAGSFLISKALGVGADVYITADMKYHEFFDANDRIMICDIGHFESEQFTTALLYDILQEKFPTFAVLKSDINTNPVYYYL